MATEKREEARYSTMSLFSVFRHFFLVVSISFAAFYYYNNYLNVEKQHVKNVLAGLIAEEKSVVIPSHKSIAVGFGACIDLFVNGIPFVKALGLKPPKKPKYHQSIANLDQVAEMFAFFLSNGAAAERYVPQALLDVMVKKAEQMKDHRYYVGGNAPVISKRFAMENFTVFIGAKGSKKLSHQYLDNMHFTQGYGEYDDVHLIFEYKVGEKWGDYVVNRANRFILHSDRSNPELRSLESFMEVVDREKPASVLVSGLQMLDNFHFEEGVREERMGKMKTWLQGLPTTTKVHFEMASFGEIEMMKSLIENVVPHVDSLGMNEQELPNIVSILRENKITEVADSNPRTAKMLDDLRALITHVGQISERGLSRVHVHTLAYQAIWTTKGSDWKHSRAGCAKASLVAHRHVCGVDEVNPNNAKLLMDESFSLTAMSDEKRINFNEHAPISCWNEHENEICIAPVLVCTKVKQTAGGGDNITPAGMMPQL